MHAAENDVPSFCLGGNFGKLVGVAGVVGEADYFIALVVVPQNDAIPSELAASLGDAIIHRVVRKDEIIIQRA